MRPHQIQLGSNPVACVYKEKREGDLDTQTEKKQMEGEHQVTMETEIRVMQRQAKECQQPPAAGMGLNRFPCKASRRSLCPECTNTLILDFWPQQSQETG